MKRYMITALACLSLLFLAAGEAPAYSLKEGTVSLSGNSNIIFTEQSSNPGPVTRQYALSVQTGYFLVNDLELGMELSGSVFDTSLVNDTYYSVIPLLTYHMPLSERVALFAAGGVGYTRSRLSIGSSMGFPGNVTTSSMTTTEGQLGLEYFVSDQIAFRWNVQIDRSLEHHSWSTDYSSRLGIGLYFP